MPGDAAWLVANLGAEEGEPAPAGGSAAARCLAGLWRSLFDPPAFDWLPSPEDGAAAAWLNTPAASREAARAGRTLWGGPPDVVRRVHDKAFAHEVARSEGLVPAALRGAVQVLDPPDLEPEDAGVAALASRLAALPSWAQGRFTLKPRLGSSGRGRVAGESGAADTPAIRGALARLAARGGALLEPWLERDEDLSAQLYLAPDGSLHLLGTSRQVLSAAGLYRGQRGEVDRRGRVFSGSRHDEALREAAVAVAAAAASAGYWGPCGLDAFSFRGPEGVCLRPVVELNARFTAGHVAIGLVRRHLARAQEVLSLDANERGAFAFALEAPAGGWPEAGPGLVVVALPGVADARPGLVFAANAERLEGALPTRS